MKIYFYSINAVTTSTMGVGHCDAIQMELVFLAKGRQAFFFPFHVSQYQNYIVVTPLGYKI